MPRWPKGQRLSYAEVMVSMATLAELHQQAHSLGLYCGPCDRWGDADLERLISSGLGNRTVIDARFRCRDCGARVEKQVRPPVSAVGGASAYITGLV